MANRYPLVLDTTDGNKIKELPEGDNLYLRNNSIVGVQDITSLGTIDAARITVAGETIKATSLLDLTDTPASYSGQANQILKVNSTEDGLDFVSFAELGDLSVGNLDVSGDIIPDTTASYDIGSSALEFNQVYAQGFRGDLYDRQGALVFDADTGEIPYAVIVGAPDSLSEFTNDIGYVTQSDVNAALAAGITISDFVGSVFGDDSTLLVDGVASRINPAAIFGEFGGEVSGPSFRTPQLVNETTLLITTDGPFLTQIIDIQPGGTDSFVNITAPNIQLLGDIQNRLQLEEGVDVKKGIAGDLTGSVYYDDSTQIIDAVSGRIVNPVVSGTATFENDVNISQNLLITGNLTVQGTTTSVETTNTTVTDNVIVLNNGEAGAGVTAGSGTSGIEIDRGSEANVSLVWDEANEWFTIGSNTFKANTFEAVAFSGSLLYNGGQNSPLQIFSGQNGQTGNTIFINPYGSDTYLLQQAETHEWRTGPYLSSAGNPYVQFKTAGAFKALNGAYFEGNLTGDVVGSVFADDSSVMVDAVNNQLVADKVITPLIEGPSNAVGIVGAIAALGSSHSITANAGPVTITSQGSTVYLTGDGGQNGIKYDDSDGSITLATTGVTTIQGAASAAINIGNGTSGTVTLGNGSNTVGFTSGTTIDFNGATISNFSGNVAGDVTGNIDNTTLNLGTSNATAITIGNGSSTTTVEGTIQFTNALIANNLRADDSITITTATGDGNAITLGPQGTNTAVNINADSIRLLGDLIDNLSAVGGITGDLKGSVFGDDSTILVDAVNSVIPYGVLDGVPTALSDFNNDLDYASIVATTIQNNGLPVNTFMTGDLDAQNNEIANANLVNATGNLTGDVKGSVFADDSSVMVDAVNFAMFTDALTLTPLSEAPTTPITGMLVAADGVSWDPDGKAGAVPYPVFYDGVAWNALY